MDPRIHWNPLRSRIRFFSLDGASIDFPKNLSQKPAISCMGTVDYIIILIASPLGSSKSSTIDE
jgi:hypothetical protein